MTDTLLETLVVQVKADTRAAQQTLNSFSSSTSDMLAVGMESAEKRMSSALERFVRTGKLNFDSLRDLALAVLADIAAAAVQTSLSNLGGGSDGGWLGTITSSLSSLGLSGRASGGPVTEGRAYVVGENGPEVFVPESAGRVQANGNGRSGGSRATTINLSVNSQSGDSRALGRSAGQIAVSVRRAVVRAQRDL